MDGWKYKNSKGIKYCSVIYYKTTFCLLDSPPDRLTFAFEKTSRQLQAFSCASSLSRFNNSFLQEKKWDKLKWKKLLRKATDLTSKLLRITQKRVVGWPWTNSFLNLQLWNYLTCPKHSRNYWVWAYSMGASHLGLEHLKTQQVAEKVQAVFCTVPLLKGPNLNLISFKFYCPSNRN